MTKEEYYRIRDEVYKNAGMDKYDFDLMMLRVVTKAVEEEREACAALCDKEAQREELADDDTLGARYGAYCCAITIRERGAP